MNPLTTVTSSVSHRTIESFRVVLNDGASTALHIARYPRSEVMPQLILFKEEMGLLDWCDKHNERYAMNAGFFLREQGKPLGDTWIDGVHSNTVPFTKPWDSLRGVLSIDGNDQIEIAPRHILPSVIDGSMVQAGPILLKQGQLARNLTNDPEGFSTAAYQFDTDITDGRYPRSAIGSNDRFIFSVVCDGYGQGEAGMTFTEFASAMTECGIKDALNLDGGSSASLIYDKKIVNRSLTGSGERFRRGRPIFSAIVFKSM